MQGNLKKILSFSVIAIFILFISSCSKGTKGIEVNNDGTVVNSKLTDREQQLMRGTGADKSFIFDVNLKNKDINWIDCWIDHYEKGELKNKITDMGTEVKPSSDNIGIIMFSIQNNLTNKPDKIEEKWILSYNSKNSGGTGSITLTKSKMNLSSVSASSEKNQIVIDKPINLAVIEEGNNVTGISEDIFSNTNSSVKGISKENSVYILRCKFIHK